MDPIWGGPGGLLGTIFGSKTELMFEAVLEDVSRTIWSDFRGQVGGQNRPKTWEGWSKINFSASRFRGLLGSVLGPIWGPSWGPKWRRNRAQDAFENALNFDLVLRPVLDAIWSVPRATWKPSCGMRGAWWGGVGGVENDRSEWKSHTPHATVGLRPTGRADCARRAGSTAAPLGLELG